MTITRTFLASFTVSLISLASISTQAQDLTHKAPPQNHPIAIIGATIHTISGDNYSNSFVTFDQGIITAVGQDNSADSFKPAPGMQIIKASGLHVYPGLIGAITGTGLIEIAAVRSTRDRDEVGQFTPEVRASVAINPDSTVIPVTRSAGILTVGVIPTGGTIPGRASIIRMDGWTTEDLAIKPDAGLVINWPSVRPVHDWWMNRTESEQKKQIKERLAKINTFFDAAELYALARKADPATPIDIRYQSMLNILPGADSQNPVFINANDIDQITSAVTWAIGRKLQPVIVGGRDAPQAATLLIEHDVPVIITGTHRFPKRADSPYDEAFTLPLRLQNAGIRWCLASGERTAHERGLRHSAATAAAYGLDPALALKSITLWAAQILNIDETLGSIEPGKAATLIVTTGNPLQITTHINHALIDGKYIDLSNKQTKLNEKYRERYRQLNMLPDNN